ncbi:hypothetical protein RRG08_023573 [Elysia crispata]|uniref:Uncharacterized protein n=1 Tax=Elysia crispata TaxID=231223 RepID=A0AAE0Z9D7_9GAST|nr:hypothetical protein RRG08_023573 [Elysia crispata]
MSNRRACQDQSPSLGVDLCRGELWQITVRTVSGVYQLDRLAPKTILALSLAKNRKAAFLNIRKEPHDLRLTLEPTMQIYLMISAPKISVWSVVRGTITTRNRIQDYHILQNDQDHSMMHTLQVVTLCENLLD